MIVRGAPKRPPIAVTDDAARAAMIIDRIRTRCPELTSDDLVLVARVIANCQRAKNGVKRPARGHRGRPKAVSDPFECRANTQHPPRGASGTPRSGR